MYRGPFVYRKDAGNGNGSLTLESAAYGGGILTPTGAMLYVTDFLGSVRAVVNGKEAQNPDFSTGYTDFGARQYSPSLRRWMTPDPLSEKYYGTSPYAFCNNNPVNLVDPDGRKVRFKIYFI